MPRRVMRTSSAVKAAFPLIVFCLAAAVQPQTAGLLLLEPNGGEMYAVGDTMHVRWEFISGNPELWNEDIGEE